MGIRVAPQRCGRMKGGARPEARRFTRLVREKRILLALSGEEQRTASQRWLGRRPEGPGAEPGGNDLTLLKTVDSAEVRGGGGHVFILTRTR